jgi:hypothetical protein
VSKEDVEKRAAMASDKKILGSKIMKGFKCSIDKVYPPFMHEEYNSQIV